MALLFLFAFAPVFPTYGEPARFTNEPRSDWSYLSEGFTFTPKKTDELRRLSPIQGEWLETRDLPQRFGVVGGEFMLVDYLREGEFVGSTGAGPCIGVILLMPGLTAYQVAVFHFGATQDPAETMKRLGSLPSGTRAAVFGGDNSGGSNFTLSGVMSYLRARRSTIHIDGFSNSVGLWVDKFGQYYRYRSDVSSTDDSANY